MFVPCYVRSGAALPPASTFRLLFKQWPALFDLSIKMAVLRAQVHASDGKVGCGCRRVGISRWCHGLRRVGGRSLRRVLRMLQERDVTVVSRAEVFASLQNQFAQRSRAQLRMPWKVRHCIGLCGRGLARVHDPYP